MLGGVVGTFDIAVVAGAVLIGFIYYFNKTQKTAGVWARMFYSNGSSKDWPCIEIFKENRIEVNTSQKKGGLLSKIKENSVPISYEMDGVPSEHRVNAGKISRCYYVSQTGSKTLGFFDFDTGAGDPVNRLLNGIGGAIERANASIHKEGSRGFMNRIPDVLMGAGMFAMVLLFVKMVFPEVSLL